MVAVVVVVVVVVVAVVAVVVVIGDRGDRGGGGRDGHSMMQPCVSPVDRGGRAACRDRSGGSGVHSNHSSFAVVWVAVLAGCAPPVGLSAFLVGADFGGRGHGGGCHGRVVVRGARSSWTRSC